MTKLQSNKLNDKVIKHHNTALWKSNKAESDKATSERNKTEIEEEMKLHDILKINLN